MRNSKICRTDRDSAEDHSPQQAVGYALVQDVGKWQLGFQLLFQAEPQFCLRVEMSLKRS
jgi:hypothetical protein